MLGHVRSIYRDLTGDAQQERAMLSTIGFTTAFAGCRIVTHSIRAGVGPFHNLSSKGGTHIHHSTFGIFGLLGIGYLWTQRIFIGNDTPPRWGSRITATGYGVAAALTLDEFALWLDLHDDYWDAQGRKSIDAVAIFAGVMSGSVIVSELLENAGRGTRLTSALRRLDVRRNLPKPVDVVPAPAPEEPSDPATALGDGVATTDG